MPHRDLYLNQDYENSSHLCELASGKVLAFLFLFIFHNDHCFPCFLSSHFLPLSPFYLPPQPHPTIHSSCLHSERGRPVMVSTKHGTRRAQRGCLNFSWEMEIGEIWLNWGSRVEMGDWVGWIGKFPRWPQIRLLEIVLVFYQ